MLSAVLKELYVQRDQLIQGIYEVTGIADIMRGASDPNETLGAQKLKAQFGSTRLKKRQRAVQKWIRDLYKLKAEIMAEHFEPDVLSQMTGQQVTPEVVELLRTDKLRSYRIDIETDSTVFEDAEAEKVATVEMLTAVAGFIEKGLPAVQATPQLAPLMFEMLGVGVRAFKEGRKLEDILNQTAEQIAQAAQQPKPDPEAQKAEAQNKRDEQLHQLKMQGEQAKTQGKIVDLQVHQQKAQTDIAKMEAQAALMPGVPAMPMVQ